ncbi:Sec-independent protein translocase protein TatC [Clostridia bacterium]|nr:Sec-independent protein translocase protein TatC [Clostridia bacterium]
MTVDETRLKKQALAEHLRALRKVVIISAAAIAVAFVALFYLANAQLIDLLLAPPRARGIEIVATRVSEALVTQLKVCMVGAIVVAMPVLTWQIWLFIAPALYAKERRLFALLFFVALVLFCVGVIFAYLYIFPLTIDLFFEAGEGVATTLWSVEQYFDFTLSFVLPFGLMFELPVAVYLMARRGWVDYKKLSKNRKYVILLIAVVSAVLTPPDIVSQTMMGLPMVLLYEVGVQVTRFAKPKVKVEDAA